MNITKNMLNKAVEEEIISKEQALRLSAFIKNLPEQSPSFNLTNVLYYFGGLIAIGAMTVFMNLGWELYGTWGILVLSLSYSILGITLAHVFKNKNLSIPAGICATFSICLTPLTIFALQQLMGFWPQDTETYRQYHYYIEWHWLYMELGTLMAGVILAYIYRYPFMIMPIAVTLWYMSMDLTMMLTGGNYSFELSALVSMYFGLITTLIGFWVDVRCAHSKDYAFWLYLFGVIAFWSGLSMQYSDSEISKFIYLCINLLLIATGVILNRKVFVLFGALGACSYLGYLAFQVFQYSYFFPVVLTLVGLGIIYLGILWQRNEACITQRLRCILPKPLKELLESKDD